MLDGLESGAEGAVDSGNVLPERFDPNQGREPEIKDEGVKPEADKQPAKDEDTKPAEGKDEQKPKKGGFVRKLEEKDGRIAELERQLAERKEAKPQDDKPTRNADDRPRSEDFNSYDEFYEALTDWKLEQREKARKEESRQGELREEAKKRDASYIERANKFQETHPDYADVMADVPDMNVNQVNILKDSEYAPEIVYWMGQNPDEAEKILSMGVMGFTKQIGKLETRFENAAADGKSDEKPEVKVTKAPAPLNTVRKGSTVSSKDPETMSPSEFRKWREQGKA